jgi:hypothetical protein
MPVPAIVPPVPAAQMKPSIRPSIWAQISGPCSRYGRGGWRCCRTGWPRSPGVSSAIRREVWTKWLGLENGAAGTSTSSARSARSVSIFSRDWVSGMTITLL